MSLNISKGNIIKCDLCGSEMEKTSGRHKHCEDCKQIAARNRRRKSYLRNIDKRRKEAKINYHKNRERYAVINKKYSKTGKKRYWIYKNSAKTKGLELDLSFDDFMKYWNSSCVYCGDQINGIGIDRIKNEVGYLKDNIQSCCSICNAMKSNNVEIDFINHCHKIVRNHGIK